MEDFSFWQLAMLPCFHRDTICDAAISKFWVQPVKEGSRDSQRFRQPCMYGRYNWGGRCAPSIVTSDMSISAALNHEVIWLSDVLPHWSAISKDATGG